MSIIRTSHNKENPYVMLNKVALEDPELSWAAKGLWGYLISRPDDWNISVSHLSNIYEKKGGGEKAIYALLNEMIEFGYCERIQVNGEKGQFKKTEYKITEFKIKVPHIPQGDAVERRAVEVPTTNKGLVINKEKQQQQTCITSSAAVSFFEKIPQLEGLDIPDSDKEWLFINHKAEAIIEAVAWATHPSTKLNGPLAAAIKWACKEKPKIPETQQDKVEKNKKYAQEIEEKHAGILDGYQINVFSKHIEILCYPYEFCLEYEENGFKEQLDNELRKRNIIKPQKE